MSAFVGFSWTPPPPPGQTPLALMAPFSVKLLHKNMYKIYLHHFNQDYIDLICFKCHLLDYLIGSDLKINVEIYINTCII